MSGKGNTAKNENKKRKSKKRKASRSPDTVCSSPTQDQAATNIPCVESASKVNIQPNQINLNPFAKSVDFVSAVMNQNTSPVVNFSPGIPFNLQPQTPNPYQPPPPPMYQSQATTPPPWATGLIEDMKSLKSVIPKIDKIEDSVNNIKTKMLSIETRVTGLENKFSEIETSCNFISNGYDSQKAELLQAKEQIKALEADCRKLESVVEKCEAKCEKVKEENLDLRSRSMRENLVFFGLQETQAENCEALVKELIKSHLDIDATAMEFDRAHRLGPNTAKKPRPVVVKFHNYKNRETILNKSREQDVRTKLKDNQLGVGVQSPPEHREARKALYPFSKRDEEMDKRTRITGNTLFVNNVPTKKYINGEVRDYTA